jgi:hypothetical protein
VVWLALAVVGIVALAGALVAYNKLLRTEPAPFFESDEEHFLFGSIGTEVSEGIPYVIWLVLPRIFPEYLPGPGGYASIGLLWREGDELPIGLSKVTVGVPRVGINCAFCHTTSVRMTPDSPRMLVPGGPSNRTSPQDYLRFLTTCASDPRFTAEVILGEISRSYRLSALDRAMYRFVVIPRMRANLLRLKERFSWMDGRPAWGAGRVDPFNRSKFTYLGQPVDETVGTSDMMPLWNAGQGSEHAYHWDGLNTSLQEVVISSALGDGTPVEWVDRDFERWNATEPREVASLRRVQTYISQLRPPKYPGSVDPVLAARGEGVYKEQCATCHDTGASRTGTIVPLDEVGTDRLRLTMWTPAAAQAYNAYGEGRSWKFSSFRTTKGYVAVPLGGVWARAPYLHNGSVPTLADLLEPPDARPKQFWRGFDLYDGVKMGFVASGADAERMGTLYDTSLPGNGNGGHLHGTSLPTESKRALVEYLKMR